MVKKKFVEAQAPFAVTSRDPEVEDFLSDVDELEDEELADQLFEMNTEEMGTMVDQVGTPDAPGSEDMSPVAMQCDTVPSLVDANMEGSPVPTVEMTEGTPIAPIEDQHAIETANQEELELFDFYDETYGEPPSPVTDKEIMDFMHEYGQAVEGDWGAMMMSALKNKFPEEYEKLLQDKPKSMMDLWETAKEALEKERGIEDANEEELALFDEVSDSQFKPMGKPLSQATDEELLGDFERLADEEAMSNKLQPSFDYNEANLDEAGQALQQWGTQPTPGVSNMTGGSSGSQGSQPDSQPLTGPQDQSGVADRTEGGTIGTTPDSAPMSQGYGQPKQVSQETLSIDDLSEEREDILPPEDEMLVSEFDSLI